MKFSVANPIYDSVFKFLMEDERIAKTVLQNGLSEETIAKALNKSVDDVKDLLND